jgi:hypothetical protein
MIGGIEKEPLIPRDQSQISVERSTGPSPAIGTHTLTDGEAISLLIPAPHHFPSSTHMFQTFVTLVTDIQRLDMRGSRS